MADHFEGVPRDDWWQMRDRIGGLAFAYWALAVFVGLILLALVRKGILTFGDLFAHEAAPGG